MSYVPVCKYIYLMKNKKTQKKLKNVKNPWCWWQNIKNATNIGKLSPKSVACISMMPGVADFRGLWRWKSLLVNSFYIHGVVCKVESGLGVFTDTCFYWTWDYWKCVRLLDGINSRDLTSRDYRLNALNFIFECFRVLGYSIGVAGDPVIPFGSLNELQIRSVFVQTYQKSPKISQMKIGTGIDIRHNRISALIIFYGFH